MGSIITKIKSIVFGQDNNKNQQLPKQEIDYITPLLSRNGDTNSLYYYSNQSGPRVIQGLSSSGIYRIMQDD
jgi:hypothetical protein